MQSRETEPTPETMSLPMDATNDVATDGDWVTSPVDDDTYNLLMALTSKLEAIDVYQVYAEDGQARLWRELADDERRHAERLFNELKQRIAAA
jgi:rubrerythrin